MPNVGDSVPKEYVEANGRADPDALRKLAQKFNGKPRRRVRANARVLSNGWKKSDGPPKD